MTKKEKEAEKERLRKRTEERKREADKEELRERTDGIDKERERKQRVNEKGIQIEPYFTRRPFQPLASIHADTMQADCTNGPQIWAFK